MCKSGSCFLSSYGTFLPSFFYFPFSLSLSLSITLSPFLFLTLSPFSLRHSTSSSLPHSSAFPLVLLIESTYHAEWKNRALEWRPDLWNRMTVEPGGSHLIAIALHRHHGPIPKRNVCPNGASTQERTRTRETLTTVVNNDYEVCFDLAPRK